MAKSPAVIVLGLGRFGTALARELTANHVDVMGVDASPKLVNNCASFLNHVTVADTTDEETLRQLGVDQAQRVVIGIGTNLEASILTASLVVEFGVPDIWAKADSPEHARILRRLGVHHVIMPESDTGRRVAHLLGGRLEDYVEFDPQFGFTALALSKPLSVAQAWATHGVSVTAVRVDGSWIPPQSEAVLEAGTAVLLSGSPKAIDRAATVL